MKPKGYSTQPPTILSPDGTMWYVRVDVAPHYTIGTTVRILGSSQTYVNKNLEKFTGPASTDDYPVDHDKLLKYARQRLWQYERSQCKKEVARRLANLLKGG